jgi:hypothetical protein
LNKKVKSTQDTLKDLRYRLAIVDRQVSNCEPCEETDYLIKQREDLGRAVLRTESQIMEGICQELISEIEAKIVDAYSVHSFILTRTQVWPPVNGFFNILRSNFPMKEVGDQALKQRAERLLAPYLK